MGLRFCDWVGVPVPPMEVFSGYWRQLLQILYLPLLGVLARGTLIDSWEFQLFLVSSLSLFQVGLPVFSPSVLYYPVPCLVLFLLCEIQVPILGTHCYLAFWVCGLLCGYPLRYPLVSGYIPYLSFCFWVTSLRMIFSRSSICLQISGCHCF